ncbi:MAG: single-stranded DNA-binding protein [Longispora sp.]|nr:single-stranded DNA-binding protein [Longispora sp. (in: high G+C Gram-positive bacteria)]
MQGQTQVTVVGNLTDEPELRSTPSGVAVAKFTVAVNPRIFDKTSGEWKDGEASFHRCTAWRQLAENIAGSLAKGTRVIVTGTLSERRWEKDGEKRSGWEITADSCGPDLTYATATVQRMTKSSNGTVAPDDPWQSASRTRPSEPVPANAGRFDNEEPPF